MKSLFVLFVAGTFVQSVNAQLWTRVTRCTDLAERPFVYDEDDEDDGDAAEFNIPE